MLTEQRFERILERLKVKKSITVAEITEDRNFGIHGKEGYYCA